MNENHAADNIEDKKEFVSARAFTFAYQNATKVAPSLNVSQFDEIISKAALVEVNIRPKIELKVVSNFIHVCLDANFSEHEFYMIGNKMHEFHCTWFAKLFKLNLEIDMPIRNDVSFIEVDHKIEAGEFLMHLSINEMLSLIHI